MEEIGGPRKGDERREGARGVRTADQNRQNTLGGERMRKKETVTERTGALVSL